MGLLHLPEFFRLNSTKRFVNDKENSWKFEKKNIGKRLILEMFGTKERKPPKAISMFDVIYTHGKKSRLPMYLVNNGCFVKSSKNFSNVTTLNQTDRKYCDCCPDPRSGHRIFATKDFVYMIGGYSPSGRLDKTFTDVWRLNILTEKWRKCSLVKGLMPDCLASFSLVQTNHPNEVFVYGGTGVPFGNSASDDLYKINMSEDGEIQLQKSIITGEESLKPPRIYGHAMCFAQSYDEKQKTAPIIYLVGGTTGYEYNIDVWKLQLSNNYLKTGTSVWESKLLTGHTNHNENGRYRLEVIFHQNQLITFGGGAPEFCAEFNYLLTFDLATETFVNLKTTPDKQHGYPEGRKCHAIVEYKREVYIIGGCKDRLLGSNSRRECKMTNDVWRLNLATKQWTKLNASLPQPVFFHSAAVTSEGCVYVFGGCTDVNSQSRTNKIFRMWLRPPTLRHLAMRALRKNYYYSQKRVDDMLLSNPNQVIRNLAVSKKYACPEKCL